jgi:hypothetical protein
MTKEEVVLDLIDVWHSENGLNCSLSDFLGMTEEEYELYALTGELLNGYEPPEY